MKVFMPVSGLSRVSSPFVAIQCIRGVSVVPEIAAVVSYLLSSVPIHFPAAGQFYCYALLR